MAKENLSVGDIVKHNTLNGPDLIVVKIEKKNKSIGEDKITCRYLSNNVFYEHSFIPSELTLKEKKQGGIKMTFSY